MKVNIVVSNEWKSLDSEIQNKLMKYQLTYPIKLSSIAKEFNIKILSSTLRNDISGEIRDINGQVTIKVNRHDVKSRQRFTIAHELAHFFLHRELLREGIVDDVLYRSSHSNVIEQEANRLGADILMPVDVIKQLISQNPQCTDSTQKIEFLAKELDVSVTAIKIRLGLEK